MLPADPSRRLVVLLVIFVVATLAGGLNLLGGDYLMFLLFGVPAVGSAMGAVQAYAEARDRLEG